MQSFFRCGAAALAVALALPSGPANAQAYPTRSVTIVVPLAAGTGMDSLVRIYGDKLSHALGKPVVIENKPGAALMLGAAHVAASAPDGYTLGVTTSSVMAFNPVLYKKVNYNPDGFAPISLYVKSPFILVVGQDVPAKSAADLVKLAKESKDPLTFASTGTGTALHLAGEYMKHRFGLTMTHVPYRNTAQSLGDVMTGRVTFSFAEAGASIPLVKQGKLRALAVSSSTRLPNLPDVPTFAEAVKVPDFEIVSWHLLVAPSATPKPIVNRLQVEMKTIMDMPDVQTRISNIGLIAVNMPSVEDVQKFIASERDKWSTLVKDLGLVGSQ
ncbi:MAG: tripartite tricarboxylate transporter substrate binding protein [Rhizobiales bacterium]|nr:tripartite tricarboxylate transporter substrate binding protein [Hyphomicrobiales bacterium]